MGQAFVFEGSVAKLTAERLEKDGLTIVVTLEKDFYDKSANEKGN